MAEQKTALVYMKDPNSGDMIEITVPAKTLAQVRNLQEKANKERFSKQREEIAKSFELDVDESEQPAVAGMTLMYDFDRGATAKLIATNLIPDLRERPRVEDGYSWSKPKPVKPKAPKPKPSRVPPQA